METTEVEGEVELIHRAVQQIGTYYWGWGPCKRHLKRTQVLDPSGRLVGYSQLTLPLQRNGLRVVQPYGSSFMLARQAGWRGQKSLLLTPQGLQGHEGVWYSTLLQYLQEVADHRTGL